MFKKSILLQSMLMAIVMPAAVVAEITTSMELKNETAFFTRSGQTIGQPTSMLDTASDNGSGDIMKFENSARIFFNGDIGESSTWHGELKIIYDTEAVNDEPNGGVNYKGHENYSQQDYFRELYMDTQASDWYLRLGKQQVVWGTADGIKLLDIINPTDFREVNQNVMEDARIPIWMVNAEKNIGDTGNFQVVVSEVQENRIPGLNPGGDQSQPFIMKGVDTITGKVNGFYNIAPALGGVANSFVAAAPGSFGGALANFGGLTVHGYAGGGGLGGGFAGVSGAVELNTFAQNGLFAGDPNGNNNVTNLLDITGPATTDVTWSPTAPTAAFEFMPSATFATFNTFAGINTTYVRDYPDDDVNAGFRFKSTLDNGFNYSLNYFHHYSANPDVNLSWHSRATGEQLSVYRAAAGVGGVPDSTPATGVTAAAVEAVTNWGAAAPVTILLKDSVGNFYAASTVVDDTTGAQATVTSGVDLRFTESLHRVNSIGAAFDFAIDTDFAPLVLRGEFLYDKDDTQIVVNKALLAIGDLTNALTVQDADYFKYVIGLDATVMTNLLVSGQFIQFRNLDYEETSRTCTTQAGQNLGDGAGAAVSYDCSTFTADPTTLSLTDGMKRGYETKEFVSLFFSKPIGEDQLGRWNNITIFEEGGGWWNRLDAEYSVTDQFIVSGQWNNYWGDDDTTFGQLDKSSSVQIGLKYIFE